MRYERHELTIAKYTYFFNPDVTWSNEGDRFVWNDYGMNARMNADWITSIELTLAEITYTQQQRKLTPNNVNYDNDFALRIFLSLSLIL